MNLYRNLLKIWIGIVSLAGFVTGWIFIARASELETVTYVGNTAITMPVLQPIPTVDGLAGEQLTTSNVQTFTVNTVVQQQQTFTQPMRTGGS
ncbi:MAG TPA: hypothetical protein PLQ75_02240 [Anaerolineales bacterium]|nr:hypothetical protein [Anaerolineales bacterium]HNF93443.1 hypothetical protein [Anaerolineales bacterium]